MGKTILVCGGRDYYNKEKIHEVLNHYVYEAIYLGTEPKNITIVQGGAKGADSLAKNYAENWGLHGLVSKTFTADWGKHGKAAGPIRNQQMLDEGRPDIVVAFPGGSGTADMILRAKKADIRVIEVPDG